MPQNEFVPRNYKSVPNTSTSNPASIHLESTDGGQSSDFTFEAINPGLFRTTFSSPSHPLPPFPSARRPNREEPFFTTSQSSLVSQTFTCGDVEATVDWTDTPVVSIGFRGAAPLHADLPFRSYAFDGPGAAHYARYHRGSLHLGLGEKAAPMDLSNRAFALAATDCFGYDVHRSDPLYKHIPLLIRATPAGAAATFSTSHARGFCSVGAEVDGMWGPYTVSRQDHGGLEVYLLLGRTLPELVARYAALAGHPRPVPRWALGYLAGGMKYSMSDAPRASAALRAFADRCARHDLPCSGFQLSSGYTVAEAPPHTRNVFTWNRHRFPDPPAFCRDFRRRGLRLIANVKPYVLASHPEYERLVRAGALFRDPRTGRTAVARLWSAGGGESGEGGHIDFSSKAGYEFWYEGVRALRETGMDCMWNDNNEYVIPNDEWEMALDHAAVRAGTRSDAPGGGGGVGERKDIALWGRAMHTELMAHASHAALAAAAPHERPFVLTRSATAGTMRYASSTWSGDNVTSWAGMRGANALSLTAGVCLLQSYGHDIGGFEGPQPGAELLLRWVQLGVHSPRFAINCFKTGADNHVGDVIEPWMYPEILPQVREALRRRYELIPYLYALMLASHLTAVPPQRWTGWGYDADAEVWSDRVLKDGETQYWLGSSLLVAGVYEPGVAEARVYLPKNSPQDLGFLNTNPPFQYLPAGGWHTIASPWESSIPVLARIGGAVPVGKNGQTAAPGDRTNEAQLPADDWRGVEIFPPPEEHCAAAVETDWHENEWLEDDGISPSPTPMATFRLAYAASRTRVQVVFAGNTEAGFAPPWLEYGLDVILPVGDRRPIFSADGKVVEPRREDERGRRRFHIVC